jgi:predicted AAA+ superfamily ATPase
MYITRKLEKEIIKYLDRREVLAILGPRQAGKTTLLKKIGNENLKDKKVKYITFEKRSDLKLFENSIEDFKDLIIDYDFVFIDEFQYADDCGQKLKYLYDETDVKFIISGSASLELRYKVGKYMVGRMIDFNLWQFSFLEYLDSQDSELYNLLQKRINIGNLLSFDVGTGFGQEINERLAKKMEKFVIYGGYPAVVLSDTKEEKEKILENILDKFLLKDIKSLLELATEDELLKLGRFLSTQIGNVINYEELSSASGLRYENLKKHLNILQKTFIIELIFPFFSNKKTELVKNPECFYHDLGLRNSLSLDFRELETRNDMGLVMENYAYIALRNLDISKQIKFWRTKSCAEVDFVIEKNNQQIPIEVKYSSKRVVGKSFYSFLRKYNPSVGIILTKDYLAEEKIGNTVVKFIPLTYL